MTAVALGYFCYDGLDMWRAGFQHKDWSIFLHHALIIFGITVSVLLRMCAPFVYLTATAEINTVFLLCRKMLCLLGHGGGGGSGGGGGRGKGGAHPAFVLCWLGLAATFVWSRLYIHGHAVYLTWLTAQTPGLRVVGLLGLLGGVPIYALNWNLLAQLLWADWGRRWWPAGGGRVAKKIR